MDDPWAAALAGDEGVDFLARQDEVHLAPDAFVIRHRFFDDFVLSAVQSRVRQVVLVAAGLDTRAYRLAWPIGT
jgi:methyltransferase (TIGR00027 family)